MQLPQSKARQVYIDQVKAVEEKLKAATASGKNQTLLSQVQNEIDRLAKKYQYDKEVGKALYKLYELQALAHYFNGEDDDALDFINQAIETRGDSYARAEKLKAQLLAKNRTPKAVEPSKMTKAERRKQKIGLEGWLAVFIVALSLTALLNIVNLFGYPSVFNDLASVADDSPQFVADFTPALWFEVGMGVLAVGVIVWILVLLAKRKTLAKYVAAAWLALNVLLIFIDYAWGTSVMDSYNLDSSDVASDAYRQAQRAVLSAIVWIPYLFISRRVRRTLTK